MKLNLWFISGLIVGFFSLVIAFSNFNDRVPMLSLNYQKGGQNGLFLELTDSGLRTAKPQKQSYIAPTNLGKAHTLGFRGNNRVWFGLNGSQTDTPKPTIVLLHGSGRSGRSMLDMWSETAKRNDLVLIAPNALHSHWATSEDGEAFLEKVLAEAAKEYPIDTNQLFLFGHSSGGVQAQSIANKGFGPWKAIATHAGVLPLGRIMPARDALPLHLYIGTDDLIFPLGAARTSAQRLALAGHDVELIIIPDHSHWYYRIGPKISESAWERFRSHAPVTVTSDAN